MNPYADWPKTGRRNSSQVVRYGCRLALQSFALCNAAIVGILILLMISAPTHAQVCGTPPCGGAGGGAGRPISIRLTQDMAFGTLAADADIAGTATIEPLTEIKIVAGGVADFGGVHAAAIFAISGKKNTPFTIMLPLDGVVTLTGPGNPMTLNNFTSAPAVGLLNNTGKADIRVGATLQVGANQAAGNYSGVFDATVNY